MNPSSSINPDMVALESSSPSEAANDDSEQEVVDCPICLEPIVSRDDGGSNSSSSSQSRRYAGRLEPCGHQYHEDCWQGWFAVRPKNEIMCPCCNERIARCCLCNQHVAGFTPTNSMFAPSSELTVMESSSSSSSLSSSPSSSHENQEVSEAVGIPIHGNGDDDEDDDDAGNIDTIVRQGLWSDDLYSVQNAMEKLFNTTNPALEQMISLGTHAIIIRNMERFEDELLIDESSGLLLSSRVLWSMYVVFRKVMHGEYYVDHSLAGSGLLSVVKVMHAHSTCDHVVKTGAAAISCILMCLESLYNLTPYARAHAMTIVQPLMAHGFLRLMVKSMKHFLEPSKASSEVLEDGIKIPSETHPYPLTDALMNLFLFLVYFAGPSHVADLAGNIDNDDGDTTAINNNTANTGFGVVLSLMSTFPDNFLAQYYGSGVITLCAEATDASAAGRSYRKCLVQLGAIDIVSRALSFPHEEVRAEAATALKALNNVKPGIELPGED